MNSPVSASAFLAQIAAICLSLMGGMFVVGCSDAADSSPVTVRVTDSNGVPLSAYVAIVGYKDDIVEIECPGKGEGAVSCSRDAISVVDVSADLRVTVKAAGYAFAQSYWNLEALEAASGRVTIPVAALSSFTQTADYATGFNNNQGVDVFTELARENRSSLGAQFVMKFYIENIDGDPRVYFINTRMHPLHYSFVKDVLHSELTERDYQQQTYVDENRNMMAGTLMFFPDAEVRLSRLDATAVAPMILTFFPSDRLNPAQARIAHRLIEERLGFLAYRGLNRRLFYTPAGSDQSTEMIPETRLFEEAGIPWMNKNELYGNSTLQLLNAGDTYGMLRRVSGDALDSMVVSSRDVLLLTTLPIELPLVAGTITEELQTPLSHVNIAALNRGTPNIAMVDAGENAAITSLVGKYVHFKVTDDDWMVEEATLEQVEAFWQQHQPPAVTLASDLEETVLNAFKEISFADSTRYGVKAANVAELSGLLGPQAPYGFAVPFAHYRDFVNNADVTDALCLEARADCVEEQRSDDVCKDALDMCRLNSSQTIHDYTTALVSDARVSSNTQLREALLDGVRYIMRHSAVDEVFAQELNQKVSDMFGSFKVRLRSSTNAEDLSDFSGAGLYDSVSAVATDASDLPSDEIRKVWASLWNWRAFEERSYWNMDHFSIYMGVLIHQAYPNEAANGVLITRNLAEPTVDGYYINVQPGEVSVTNPEGETPEVTAILAGNETGNVQSANYAYSSLSPETAILSDDEIQVLYDAAVKAHRHFAQLYERSPWNSAVFDMEFKFNQPDRNLVIKQIRPFPMP